ncbi:MAG: DUF3990 domain-containing protein [Bacillota bacterium]
MIIANTIQELPTKWYHGTTHFAALEIKQNGIDLGKSRRRLDFGPGFYLTSNLSQAAKQAKRKAIAYNLEQDQLFCDFEKVQNYADSLILAYELDIETLNICEGYFFTANNDDWAKFILGNRSKNPEKYNWVFHNQDQRIDYVYGPLADGMKIPRLIRDVERGKITQSEFLKEISQTYSFPTENQMSIHTEIAINSLILKEVIFVDEASKPIERRG